MNPLDMWRVFVCSFALSSRYSRLEGPLRCFSCRRIFADPEETIRQSTLSCVSDVNAHANLRPQHRPRRYETLSVSIVLYTYGSVITYRDSVYRYDSRTASLKIKWSASRIAKCTRSSFLWPDVGQWARNQHLTADRTITLVPSTSPKMGLCACFRVSIALEEEKIATGNAPTLSHPE